MPTYRIVSTDFFHAPAAEVPDAEVPDTDASTTVTVLDRDGLEPCGLFDDELEVIWNNDDLVEVLSDARENVARKDPETGDVWVMCWARVGARGEVSDGG